MWSESLALWQDIDLFFRAFIQGYRFQKFFDLPPDLHNRCNHASLSRANFYDRQKQESRLQIVRNAVELLEAHNMSAKRRWAKFMAAEIAMGNASARHFDLSATMADFAWRHEVITRQEFARLNRVRQVFRYRLYRMPGMKAWLRKVEASFACTSLLGCVPVGMETKYGALHAETMPL